MPGRSARKEAACRKRICNQSPSRKFISRPCNKTRRSHVNLHGAARAHSPHDRRPRPGCGPAAAGGLRRVDCCGGRSVLCSPAPNSTSAQFALEFRPERNARAGAVRLALGNPSPFGVVIVFTAVSGQRRICGAPPK